MKKIVTWASNATNDYSGLFGQLGIGIGKEEFERGRLMLTMWEYNWLDYRPAVKALKEWCGMKSEVDTNGNFLANMNPDEWKDTFRLEHVGPGQEAYNEYRDYLISLDATEYFLTDDEKQVAFKALKEWCGINV